MSKWVNNDLFGKFREQKKEEKNRYRGVRRLDQVWDTPEKGTETQPKVYEGRFLPDPDGEFYKMYYYHMWQAGEKWVFYICPKTDDFTNFCPICSVTSKLYVGTAADKKMANQYKRKRKFVGNFYIVKDPRDEDKEAEDKSAGLVRLYEFPNKVEMKLKEEITDTENGLGGAIFDPGADGYNFILKVLSTKASTDGKTWPDYTNSLFARKNGPLGSDDEIDEIMAKTFKIADYIDSLRKSDDEIEKVLKEEELMDFIQDEWTAYRKKKDAAYAPPVEDDIDDEALYQKHLDEQKDKPKEEEPAPTPTAESDEPAEKNSEDEPPWEQSDDELLAELKDL